MAVSEDSIVPVRIVSSDDVPRTRSRVNLAQTAKGWRVNEYTVEIEHGIIGDGLGTAQVERDGNMVHRLRQLMREVGDAAQEEAERRNREGHTTP